MRNNTEAGGKQPGQTEGKRDFPSVSFEQVLREELGVIHARRHPSEPSSTPSTTADPFVEALNADLIGLSLSGGGIRSATFNLGVMQALARLNVLPAVDYLSTVSGGGYIGSFLTSWIKRRGRNEVVDELDPTHRKATPSNESEEVQFLRDYSNYLTPRLGFLRFDFWTMVVTYARNFLLNITVLILALTGLLFLPRFAIDLYSYSHIFLNETSVYWASLLFVIAISVMVGNLSSLIRIGEGKSVKLKYGGETSVLFFVIIPLVLAAFILNHWLWYNGDELPQEWYYWAIAGGLAYSMQWLLASVIGFLLRSRSVTPEDTAAGLDSSKSNGDESWHSTLRGIHTRTRQGLHDVRKREPGLKVGAILLSAAVSGALGGIILMWASQWISSFSEDTPGLLIFGVSVLSGVFLLVGTLHVGLAGQAFSEEVREWWGRLGAVFVMMTLVLTALIAMAIYGGDWFSWLIDLGSNRLMDWIKAGITSGWILTTLAGVIAGRSERTGASQSSVPLELIGKIAPVVFVAGLLFFIQWLVDLIFTSSMEEKNLILQLEFEIMWIVLLLLSAYALSRRVGVNDFSMNAFYKNRLVRCYLGATNADRNAHPFTGFDPHDDNIRLQQLQAGYQGPYPIINTALNLVQGRKLSWQNRKAASFFFSPLYSGYDTSADQINEPAGKTVRKFGYRPTEWYGESLTLGNAVSISGAAASPCMGYHSSPPLTFLMTIFNVRLGAWFANPRYEGRVQPRRQGPSAGLFYLFFELLGKANDERGYVYLSDGGHFENLGIYELVRRRCKLIIAVDAGEDESLSFGDLGNAIEKCRVDLGVNIDLDVKPVRAKGKSKASTWHCVRGKVHYPEQFPEDPGATIIYLKSSMTADEPIDIARYRAKYPHFPHESTADQFFGESQFESYRMLGYHVGWETFKSIPGGLATPDTHKMIENLDKCWDPSLLDKDETYVRMAGIKQILTCLSSNRKGFRTHQA